MGGRVPGPSLTVDDVARLVGPSRMCDVIGEFCLNQADPRRRNPAFITVAIVEMGRICQGAS